MKRYDRLVMRLKKQLGKWVGVVVVGLACGGAVSVHASMLEYYVGVDGLQTIASGTYAGLNNPNHGRLTFLFAHPNETTPSTSHYHSIGAWSYSGPPGNPVVNTTNTNNRIPEILSGQAPLPLVPGQGAQAGRWVNQAVPGLEYSNLRMASTQSLSQAAPGTTEHYLFNSSGGRWTGSLNAVSLALELVSLTPGLQVADQTGAPIFSAIGQTYKLGEGNPFSFTPSFYTNDNTRSRYSAAFRFVDLNGTLRDSGTFHMDFAPVPLPAAAWLMASALTGLAVLKRRGVI
ncbi:MAG: VPLPA-CTERM sorting domain-containing protein [Nitrospira sp.]|jgi:hypothetical protein|nr:VPLPA-CTERM sorting domain-containing protein [Nitrospira sp.]